MKKLFLFLLCYGGVNAQNDDDGRTINIPVIFHVIYSDRQHDSAGGANTSENVTTALLIAELNSLNLDFLKLRASWGILGNDLVGGWQWRSGHNISGDYFFSDIGRIMDRDRPYLGRMIFIADRETQALLHGGAVEPEKSPYQAVLDGFLAAIKTICDPEFQKRNGRRNAIPFNHPHRTYRNH